MFGDDKELLTLLENLYIRELFDLSEDVNKRTYMKKQQYQHQYCSVSKDCSYKSVVSRGWCRHEYCSILEDVMEGLFIFI